MGDESRRTALALLAKHAIQIRRALAAVGAVPDQLSQLGDAVLDDAVSIELTLLTHEAAWQLRALARQTRRRWRLLASEQFPTELQSWLDDVEDFATRVSGAAATHGVSEVA